MRSSRGLAGIGAALLALALAASPALPGLAAPPSEPVQRIDGVDMVSASSLTRLLQATRFWRSDVRKLVLRSGTHRMVFTVDNPFALIDDRTVRLPSPVRSRHGELQIPVALVDSLPRDTTIARLLFEPRMARVVVVPPGGVVNGPVLVQIDGGTRVTFRCDQPEQVKVVGRGRANFRMHFEGYFTGVLPDTVPPPTLVRRIHELPTSIGSAFELEIGEDAAGWKLTRERDRIVLELSRRGGPDLESFAPEGPPGPRSLRVIVLDPGHGGADAGVSAGGLVEKDLALALARALKPELERRVGARVVLTRDSDVALGPDPRAEAANRARADLVLSLHFDGVPGSTARGLTAYAPPATFGAGAAPVPGQPTPVEILPWREVATRHAVRSREIGESITAYVELRGQGPARLRETLPATLLGVNAPGLLLECATLTSARDLDRLSAPRGITDLAAAIAEGVAAWQKQP